MTTIAEDAGLVTAINVLTVEPSNQQRLLDMLVRAADTPYVVFHRIVVKESLRRAAQIGWPEAGTR